MQQNKSCLIKKEALKEKERSVEMPHLKEDIADNDLSLNEIRNSMKSVCLIVKLNYTKLIFYFLK